MQHFAQVLMFSSMVLSAQVWANAASSECDTSGISQKTEQEVAEFYGWEPSVFPEYTGPVDLKTTKFICLFARRTKYESMIRTIDRNGWELHEIYPHVDCRRAGLQGPTLLHMITQRSARLLLTGVKIAEDLHEAQQANPDFDMAPYFNETVPYASSCRTVLGILDWHYNGPGLPDDLNPDSILLREYRELRRLLIQMGAK